MERIYFIGLMLAIGMISFGYSQRSELGDLPDPKQAPVMSQGQGSIGGFTGATTVTLTAEPSTTGATWTIPTTSGSSSIISPICQVNPTNSVTYCDVR